MPGDRAKAGARKVKRISEDLDVSWHRRKQCEVCGVEFVVNNYPDRKPRTPKYLGRIVCPWCISRGGRTFVELLIFAENSKKKMAAQITARHQRRLLKRRSDPADGSS